MKHDEALIQVEIVKYLRSIGVFCHSVANELAGGNAVRTGQAVSMGLFPGVADLIVWVPSVDIYKIIYIEVKTATGKQSPAQVKFQARCDAAGVVYRIVRSVDDIKDLLQKMLKSS